MTVRRHRERERGAAAVEFALVVPILVMLLLGIVDYGMYFSDSLAVRDGIREGAREGVVKEPKWCGGGDLDCLAQLTKDRVGAIGGTTYVHVAVDGPGGWKEDNQLIVCAVVIPDGLTGFTPMPDRITGSVRMRIEHDVDANGVHGQTGTPPEGWDSGCEASP